MRNVGYLFARCGYPDQEQTYVQLRLDESQAAQLGFDEDVSVIEAATKQAAIEEMVARLNNENVTGTLRIDDQRNEPPASFHDCEYSVRCNQSWPCEHHLEEQA